MDKNQATDFIINRLNLGINETEIVTDLSQKLGAPPAIIKKFVDQVASTHQPTPPSIPLPATQEPKTQPPFVFEEEDQLSEFESDLTMEQTEKSIQVNTDNLSNASNVQPNQKLPQKPGKQFDIQLVTQDVLQAVKKHQRHNDIVEMVCSRTGWHWNEAQRFVARVQTENHSDLYKSQKRFMLPFSAVFILGGILLMIWSALAMIDFYRRFTDYTYVSTLAIDFLPLVIGAFFTSLGLIAGGIFGFYRTLTSN